MNEQQEMKGVLYNFRKQIALDTIRGGIPGLYNKLWAGEATDTEPAGKLRDGWKDLEAFLREIGVLDSATSLLREMHGTGDQRGQRVLKLQINLLEPF